ncbi:hypothetical protein [Asticcacaulis sp. W401b]|uniref:hypothetical protein n=1 Tax=Asticcacaulis sp. W401b TaxID=3388666 RepID=UPI0039708B03
MTTQSSTTLKPITVRLGALDIAAENPRYLEGPDDQIPDLAESLDPKGPGLLIPLLVRAGTKSEKPYMVLDGRRRLHGYWHLLANDRVSEDLEISVLVCEGKDAIAAAAITANIARLPVKQADLVLAVRALIGKKLKVEQIARALCVEVGIARRYVGVARADMDVLMAFRDGLFDFAVLKLIARLSLTEQRTMAKHARANGRLYSSFVQDYLDAAGFSALSPLMSFIGIDAYREAGGRVTSDLLGELPDTCVDIETAHRLWTEKVSPIKELLESQGLAVFVVASEDYDLGDEYTDAPYRYRRSADLEADMKAAAAGLSAAREALAQSEDPNAIELWTGMAAAEFDVAHAKMAPMAVRAAILSIGARQALDFEFVTTDEDVEAWREAERSAAPESTIAATKVADPIPERPVVVDTSDRGNAFHRAATDATVRGFRRALADNFMPALKLQISTLFQQVVLVEGYNADLNRALAVSCRRNIQSDSFGAIPGLDRDLVDRLLAYRQDFLDSGLRPYPWVSQLPFARIQDLLALMTAASVAISEDRVDGLRRKARAEVQEVSEEIDFDLRTYWYPDGEFYRKCSKAQLLGYAERMGCDVEELGGLKKAALADFVAEAAVQREWQPSAFSFTNDELPPEKEHESVADDEADETDTDGPNDDEGEAKSDGDDEGVAEAAE